MLRCKEKEKYILVINRCLALSRTTCWRVNIPEIDDESAEYGIWYTEI